MEVIKRFESGKAKIKHDDIVIFVKPYSFGNAHGMIVRSNSRRLSESEAKTAYKMATSREASLCLRGGDNWEVREDV